MQNIPRARRPLHRLVVAAVFVSISAILLFAGCASTYKPPQVTVDSPREVASTHLTVYSVIPWDKYKHQLQPRFAVDESTALSLARRRTADLRSRYRNATGFSLRAGLPKNQFAEYDTLIIVDGDTFRRKVQTSSRESGSESTSGSSGQLSNLAFGDSFPDLTISSDPRLEYAEATALLQEINLINGYIDYAVNTFGIDRYNAYIVRMSLGITPLARKMPYDSYTTIGFSGTGFTEIANPQIAQMEARVREGGQRHMLFGDTETESNTPPTDPRGEDGVVTDFAPIIVPLIAADQLESARSYTEILDAFTIGLSLSGAAGGTAVNIGADSVAEMLEQSLVTEYNTLSTVMAASQNTIRVRIGAQRIGQDRYEMLAKNTPITLLCLVPKDFGLVGIQAMAATHFVDARTGRRPGGGASDLKIWAEDIDVNEWDESPHPSGHQIHDDRWDRIDAVEELSDLLRSYLQSPPVRFDKKLLAQLVRDHAMVRYAEFLVTLQELDKEYSIQVPELANFAHAIWVDMTDLYATSPYVSSVQWWLPKRALAPVHNEDHRWLAYDDGSKTRIRVLDGYGDPVTSLYASLSFKYGSADITVPATAISREQTGKALAVDFPSLASMKIDPSGELEISIKQAAHLDCLVTGKVTYVEKPPKKPVKMVKFPYQMTTDTKMIPKDDTNSAFVGIRIKSPDNAPGSSTLLRVAGAAIYPDESVLNATLKKTSEGDLRVLASGSAIIKLLSVSNNSEVKLCLVGAKGEQLSNELVVRIGG